MGVLDVLEKTTGYAKAYRKEAIKSVNRNRHMNDLKENEIIVPEHVDAILVDFINYIATRHGIDYALYTKDLTNGTN